MMYHKKPTNYIPDMQVSEGILEYNGKILLVQRANHCSAPGTWCGPGGKLESGETHLQALIREIFEETGIDISDRYTQEIFTKYFYFLGKNITITFYKIIFESEPHIILNSEHQDYIWTTPKQALSMNLNEDFDTILKEMYEI